MNILTEHIKKQLDELDVREILWLEKSVITIKISFSATTQIPKKQCLLNSIRPTFEGETYSKWDNQNIFLPHR